MIKHCSGSIFRSGAEALVNPVNCVGVMGAGLAKEFARRWPAMVDCYRYACRARLLRTGKVWTFAPNDGHDTRLVICFPTKDHWRSRSRLEDIEAGLRSLAVLLASSRLRSVAVPALGCGLGGLAWGDVRPLIERLLADVPCDVLLYGP